MTDTKNHDVGENMQEGRYNDYILELRGINKSFSANQVLYDVDLKVRRGTVHALIGENGAGKSTIVKIIKGAYQYDSGKILINGEETVFRDPGASSQKGIGMVYQELSYAPNMTVAENFFLGSEVTKSRMLPGVLNRRAMLKRTSELLGAEGVTIDPNTKMSDLTISEIQMIEIIKVVSRQEAKLIILDEPTSSLSERETELLFNEIRSLKNRGVSVIYISHKLDEIKQIADDVTILRDGHVVETGEISQYDVNTIVDLIVGRKMSTVFPENNVVPGDKVFEIKNFTRKHVFEDVCLNVRKGEIVGLAGRLGSGRTELMRAIVGLDAHDSGEIYLEGNQLAIRGIADSIRAGIVMVSEDRQRFGILPNCSVKENASIVILNDLNKLLGIIDRKNEADVVSKMREKMRIKVNSIDDSIRSLSGGNQQKVVLAKWMLANPKVLILDEPTRGIDVGAKFEIYNLMIEMARSGLAIIMISSELNEVISMSNRLYLIDEGRIIGELTDKADFSEERVLKMLVGGK